MKVTFSGERNSKMCRIRFHAGLLEGKIALFVLQLRVADPDGVDLDQDPDPI